MDLSTLVRSYGHPHSHGMLHMAGPSTESVLSILGNESRTKPLIATLFWQVFSESPAYGKALERAGASRMAMTESETIIVTNGQQLESYNLVVFDPAYRGTEPKATIVELSEDDKLTGWTNWKRKRESSWLAQLISSHATIRQRAHDLFVNRGSRFGGPLDDWLIAEREEAERLKADHKWSEYGLLQHVRIMTTLEMSFLSEVLSSGNFVLVVARSPSREYLKAPSPALSITSGPAPLRSSVGVVARNSDGVKGVTGAFHGLSPGLRIGDPVTVQGTVGNLVSTNEVTDSCFIGIDCDSLIKSYRGTRGPLIGVSPREGNVSYFEGAQSGHKKAIVTGWDKTVISIFPFITQEKLYTTVVTEPGDSGSALVDDSDNLLGFSYYRTGLQDPVQHSAWIWAHSVYRALNLKLDDFPGA